MSQQLQITGGAKVRDLNDVIIGTSGVLSSLAFNVANGVPKLDVNGKILVSQLPNSVMEYQGTWNASTNTPTLVNGVGNQGDVYLCNVAGTTNFGAGPITFAVGDSAIYSGTIWQRAGGATGTVTSVGLSTSGNAFTIGSSPVTTSGTITINGSGNSGQYINGAGNLTTFPTLISSIGLSMPSAFNVSNSPLTANGTIAVTGAGYPSQYIRGDGTLADFPSSGGGGSSVSYYLNGGTSQGTIGGVTYYEMSKIADTGTGVDFPKTGDGLIVSFLTDAGDPAQLNIPAGNWNYEIYASMSSNGGTPQMYAELYVYNGTTFTLISTSSNEILYDGTNLNLYTFAMTVPATTLTLTDRLAVKLYATNSGGKTTTVHTQDGHLCQVITTFSTGITALNGLTAQVQYFATGTSGTDFNISSTTATHTFNIPSASATNRGLITTGSQTIAGDKAFTGINSFDYGINYKTGASLANVSGYISQAYAKSGTGAGSTLSLKISDGNSVKAINLDFVGSPATYTYTFPAASGTISLLESNQTFTGLNTFSSVANMTASLQVQQGLLLNQGIQANALAPYTAISGYANGLFICPNSGTGYYLVFPTSSSYVYTFPAATGTLALTSNLSSYVPLAGNVNVTGPLGINTTGGAGTTGLTNFGTFITRSDSTQGFPRKLAISMASGTLVSIDASGNGANYITDMAFSTSTASGLNGTPAIYITGTNNRVGIKTGTPAYDLDVSGTGRFTGAITGGSSITATGNIRSSNAGGTIYTELTSDGVYATGTNLYLLAPATKDMVLYANDTERVRIKSGGSVLIGSNTAPSAIGVNDLLVLGKSGSASNAINFSNGSTTNWAYILAESAKMVLGSGSGSSIAFETNAGSERMRITSGGNVGIGTSSPVTKLDIVAGGDAIALALRMRSQDDYSFLQFKNFAGTQVISEIYSNRTADNTGSLIFTTNNGGVATERMRITSGGAVLIGTTSILNTSTGILQVLGTTTGVSINATLPNSASGGVCLNTQSVTSASTGWYHIVCQSGNGSSINTNNLIIYGNGNVQNANNSYGGISDIKLKENIVDATAKLDKLMQVRIVNFNLKSDLGYETFKQIGVIAQELEQIFPSLVDENKDFDAEGNDLGTTTKSVKMSVFIPMLIKAMQEQQIQIQNLQEQINILAK